MPSVAAVFVVVNVVAATAVALAYNNWCICKSVGGGEAVWMMAPATMTVATEVHLTVA